MPISSIASGHAMNLDWLVLNLGGLDWPEPASTRRPKAVVSPARFRYFGWLCAEDCFP